VYCGTCRIMRGTCLQRCVRGFARPSVTRILMGQIQNIILIKQICIGLRAWETITTTRMKILVHCTSRRHRSGRLFGQTLTLQDRREHYFNYSHIFQTVKAENQAAMFSKINSVSSSPTRSRSGSGSGSGPPQPMSNKERKETIELVLSVIDDVLDLVSETADDDQ
jgi:hypothetical protein